MRLRFNSLTTSKEYAPYADPSRNGCDEQSNDIQSHVRLIKTHGAGNHEDERQLGDDHNEVFAKYDEPAESGDRPT